MTFERSCTWQFKVGGIHSLSSRVKTLTKKLFNVLALSLGVVAVDPSSSINVGIAVLVFSLEFAYFQNAFGLSFTLMASFCS